MAKPRLKKTLYFVSGTQATQAQQEEASKLPGQVCFRNATLIHDKDALEDFDYVMGDVPKVYAIAAAQRSGDGTAIEAPKAETQAPAAPQNVQAKPGASNNAWKPN